MRFDLLKKAIATNQLTVHVCKKLINKIDDLNRDEMAEIAR